MTLARHCVIIPSYNTGPILEKTVRSVLATGAALIVVIDGSTDGSEQQLSQLQVANSAFHVVQLPVNSGKGCAVLTAMEKARSLGFTHVVVFDADGQHDADDIPRFIEASCRHPDAMVLGRPIFGDDAPPERVHGRRAGNWFAHAETWWGGIDDSLFGFRVYPTAPALAVMEKIHRGRRFDFDTQIAVRLYWAGVPPLNLDTRVTYPAQHHGGVSHFHYLRDNLLLARAHAGLLLKSFYLAPRLWKLRNRPRLTVV
jgi:glycosyltransferase involved in cell wall biosynthesis